MPTGRKPRTHMPQEISTCATRRTMSIASRFGASAVRNIELVTQVVAKAVQIRNGPICFLAALAALFVDALAGPFTEALPAPFSDALSARAPSLSGLEPYSGGMLFTMGYKVPALRAV